MITVDPSRDVDQFRICKIDSTLYAPLGDFDPVEPVGVRHVTWHRTRVQMVEFGGEQNTYDWWTTVFNRDIGPKAVTFLEAKDRIQTSIEKFTRYLWNETVWSKSMDYTIGVPPLPVGDVRMMYPLMGAKTKDLIPMYFHDFRVINNYGDRVRVPNMFMWWFRSEWTPGKECPLNWLRRSVVEETLLFGDEDLLDSHPEEQFMFLADTLD